MKNDNQSDASTNDVVPEVGSSRGAAGFMAGVLFGAFLGAGFALLFAPERGDKTRGRMKRRMQSLRKDALEGLDRASERTRKEFRRRQKHIQAELERARARAEDRLRGDEAAE